MDASRAGRVEMSLRNNQRPQSSRERILKGCPVSSLLSSAFQHLCATLITYSTFSPGEDCSLDQQDQEDMQRTFHPVNIFKLFRLVYHPLLQSKNMKFCQHFHNIHQSAPQQLNPLPTERLTHNIKKTGNSTKIKVSPQTPSTVKCPK